MKILDVFRHAGLFICTVTAWVAVSAVAMGQASTPAPPATPPAEKPAEKPAETAKLVYVNMSTTRGDIVIELNHEKAPITVDNFLKYVDEKFYEGTIFHRVISSFMIQGGGLREDMSEKAAGSPIKNEGTNGLKNVRGSIAMARMSAPDSASCQFFINVVDNAALDARPNSAGYAVFGKVVAGMGVVDSIRNVKTTTKAPHQNVPVEPIVIKSVTRITEDEAKTAMAAEMPAAAPTTPQN